MGDARESPALDDVIRLLFEEGPKTIAIYDPICNENDIKRELNVLERENAVCKRDGQVEVVSDAYSACVDSNAVLVFTDKPTTVWKPVPAADSCGGARPTDILNEAGELE